jgi:hypothetical protein
LYSFMRRLRTRGSSRFGRAGQAFFRSAVAGVFAAHAKIDNLLLVAAEHAVHIPQKKPGQMRERGEAAIGTDSSNNAKGKRMRASQ